MGERNDSRAIAYLRRSRVDEVRTGAISYVAQEAAVRQWPELATLMTPDPTNYPNVGTVSATTEENWSKTIGTTVLTGDNLWRGDIALIRYNTKLAENWVYDGAVGSVTAHAVTSTTWSDQNDYVCVNGTATGEHCGWISVIGADVRYTTQGPAVEGNNVWLRNIIVVQPDTGEECPGLGDSGGPVYRRKANGTLEARGIHSGTGILFGCVWYYTDIQHAQGGLPGVIQLN